MINCAVTASDKTTRVEPGIELATLRSAQVDDCIDTVLYLQSLFNASYNKI